MNSHLRPFLIAFAATIPGILLRIFHPEISPLLMAFLTGMAILSASFMLMWACEVAQLDIPQTLAIAVVALIAVLPEYAVDMYFTWMAGQHPESAYSHYAIANMTGANRLLIGIGWTTIVLLFATKHHSAVVIDDDKRTDVVFLFIATLYALVIPLKGTLAWYDAIVFIFIYLWYIKIIAKRPCEEVHVEGPAEVLANLDPKIRKKVTFGLFAFAAIIILLDAELFSESLVSSGKILGVNEFLLVQWLAPIASEAPEFIVAIMFALRGQANISLGSLLSSKLNQWTLLVGMIPIVYAISSGSISVPIPMDSHQMHEILLTAAQSLFAVCLLLDMRLTIREAGVLLFLFLLQFASPLYQGYLEGMLNLPHQPDRLHAYFSTIYLTLSLIVLARNFKGFKRLREGFHS